MSPMYDYQSFDTLSPSGDPLPHALRHRTPLIEVFAAYPSPTVWPSRLYNADVLRRGGMRVNIGCKQTVEARRSAGKPSP